MSDKNINDMMYQKLVTGLDSTHDLVRILLDEIRNKDADFIAVKTELSILRDGVKGLSSVIREGNGSTSLLTKTALIEKKIDDIDKWITHHESKHNNFKLLEKQVNDLSVRIKQIEEFIHAQKEEKREEQRAWRDSIHKEQELQHQKNLSDQKIMESKQKFKIALISAIIVGIITLAIGFISAIL